MSSLFNEFQGQTPNPMGRMGDFINQFNQFRSTFMGNPEQRVKELLDSGQMSQDQFNQLAQTANQLRQLIK